MECKNNLNSNNVLNIYCSLHQIKGFGAIIKHNFRTWTLKQLLGNSFSLKFWEQNK
jgi:hypothetical protein